MKTLMLCGIDELNEITMVELNGGCMPGPNGEGCTDHGSILIRFPGPIWGDIFGSIVLRG